MTPAPAPIVVPYRPRPQQWQLHVALRRWRYVVVVAHRRLGKTVWAVNHLLRDALACPNPRPRFAYVAPTLKMAKAIAWDYLRYYTPALPGVTTNTTELRVDFPTGGQVRLYGADNPDALRGLYLDGVVLDEFGMMPREVWTEVLRPCLVDRQGWACFIGTPAGHNAFWDVFEHARTSGDPEWQAFVFKASETGLVDEAELAAARRIMTEDEYAQEFEASFEASVRGAIYGREIQAARAEGRITRVPVEDALPVHTAWDLGVGDTTVIWCWQATPGGEVHLVDYYEASGEGLPHYLRWLQQRPYVWGTHWAPPDIRVRELGTGKSRWEVAKALGLRFQVVRALPVDEGIAAARLLWPRLWINEAACRVGLTHLQAYRRRWNASLQEFSPSPVHDQASHAADAFRYLVLAHTPPGQDRRRRDARPAWASPASPGGWMV